LEFLLALTYAVLFIFIIHRWKFFKNEGISPFSISLIFFLKLLFGAGLWLIYTEYYPYRQTSDSLRYFDDAAVLYESFKANPIHYLQILTGINAEAEELSHYYQDTFNWYKPYDYGLYNDNRTVIRAILLFFPFSLGYYAPQIVFFCFISLIGLMGIFKSAYPFLKQKKQELAFAVFLLPSMLFWSSGVLKEGILILGFGLFTYYLFNLLIVSPPKWKYIVWALLTFILLILVKGYVLLAIIPAGASLLVLKFTGNKYSGWKFLATHALILIGAINLYRINPNLDVLYYLHQKQGDFINVAEQFPTGSYIKTQRFEAHWSSLITNGPEAIANALFRPTIFEAHSFMMGVAAMENFMILLICGILFMHFKRPKEEQLPLLWFSVFFTISLAAIIGFVTPVLGAVVRYKIPLLPSLIIIFIIISDKEKLIKRFPFMNFLYKKI
jgi:hypothetical protein